MASPDDVSQNKTKWTAQEELAMIDLVLCHEESLFGTAKESDRSSGSIKARRLNRWGEIVSSLNSQFNNSKHTVEGVKKKYSNVKQRCKEKIDERKRHKTVTGGGPPLKKASVVEEVFMERTQNRPVMFGIPGGIDTDVEMPCSLACVGSVPDDQDDSLQPVQTKEGTPKEVPVLSTERCTKSVQKKKQSSKIDEATWENIRLDNKRIEAEIELQKETKKTHRSLRDMADTVKIYYQLKMQAEFGVEFQNDE